MKCLTCGFFSSESNSISCSLCQTASPEALWAERAAAPKVPFSLLNLFGLLGAFVVMLRSE
jgi:hypothetical protein